MPTFGLMTSVFYVAGIGFYIKARRCAGARGRRMFGRSELCLLTAIIAASVVTLCLVYRMMR